ncbi:MAG: D-aminoacylase [Candidatus Obscuribacterales bacterium]|nr:D-aminoacylase [Candidatus Obscuribacterales bacterium]
MYDFDVVIRGGTVYDGSGRPGIISDVAIKDDTLVLVEPNIKQRGEIEIDATSLAVAPGFINMLSWANETLIEDGRSQSDIRQGVTLEVMGEGVSMGPLNEEMKKNRVENQGDIKYDVTWTTLKEYLDHLVRLGISTNVASFVGATTVRVNVLGSDDVQPNLNQLEQMRQLVRQAMKDGALGVASALVYAPAFYAQTEELCELAKVAAEYGGMYTSHLRSEGDSFLEALDEFLTIARVSGARSEVYHLKAMGRPNWHKMDSAIERIEAARAEGLAVTADMYMYPAAQTGLDFSMPPWVQEGGLSKWIERMKDPEIRTQLKAEISQPSSSWENGYLHAGANGVLLVGLKKLKQYTSKTLAQVAAERGTSPEETMIDLVIEDESRIETVYFLMCEENIEKQLKKPWVSVGSDGSSLAAEGVFLKSSNHPRAYGNVARFLGHYVRDRNLMPLEEAVHRLSGLPASNLRLTKRGALRPGYFADVVVFDPATIADRATFDNPHQYSIGVHHVFVNGEQVLRDGEHTGAKPGRLIVGSITPTSVV